MEEKKTPQWQTGPIPQPTGPSHLTIECTDGYHIFYAANAYGRYGKWVYFWTDPSARWTPEKRIKGSDCTGRWFIQPIILPATSGTGESNK